MKKVLVITSILAVLVATPFLISATKNQNQTALEKLHRMEIADGYDDGELHPELILTRAQFAKLLKNSFPDAPRHDVLYNFTDLEETHWAYEDIQKVANSGWLEGFPDNTFHPDDEITYEQAVTIMCRVLGLVSYSDRYPETYLASAMEHCITDGVQCLISDKINREQAARLITNAMEHEQSIYFENDNGRANYIASSSSLSGASGGRSAAIKMQEAAESDGLALADSTYAVEIVQMPNTEEYEASSENVFKRVETSPLSTFSIDTDTASYSNLRRFILNGQEIPNGAVRSEELINYFDYEKAQTEEGTPFGVKYTISECSWNSEHDLAMITISGEELKELKPSNIVFLIDTSGSMYSFNKLPLVKQALSLLLDKLGENDKISIVTYASGTGVALEPTAATEKEKILDCLTNLRARGATAGASGITLAYEQAEKFKCDGNNRIILCTDGDFNVGISSGSDLEKLITEKRESGIFLSVLGFGMGNYKDSKMETLADKGNGNYAYIDNLREAKKVLVDEMSKTIYTIAKDVKIQTEFNIQTVSEYRLIGYENRMLNNEDFEDDTKDAGELGAGATVTVLYEIIPQNGEIKNTLKYQDIQPKGSDELMTVSIRYKTPEGEESILTEYPVSYEITDEPNEDFKFAAAVAELGMILNDSEYKGSSTYDSVIDMARAGMGKDKFGIRNEFVQLVDLLRFKEN